VLGPAVWEWEQGLKPFQNAGTMGGSSYYFCGIPYNGRPHYTPGSLDDVPPWRNFEKVLGTNIYVFNLAGPLLDRYEVMAAADQTRLIALGMAGDVHNIAANINLTSQSNGIWPPDPFNNNYKDAFWHSAEFENDNAQEMGYWKYLLGPNAFNIQLP